MSFIAALLAQGDIIWSKDWEEALKEAKARNVPVMLTIHKDG